MSLFRKLVLCVSMVLGSILLLHFFVSVTSAQTQIQLQLRAEANVAAAGLAANLSASVGDSRREQSSVLINTLFESGPYRRVVFHGVEDSVAIYRTREVTIKTVPLWFIQVSDLADGLGNASVYRDGQVYGRLFVSKHPGLAYESLWAMFLQSVWLLVGSMAVGYGLVLVLLNWVFKPLTCVINQSNNILAGRYAELTAIPKSSEANILAKANNRLISKLTGIRNEQIAISRHLHTEAHLDPLTGLPNRSAFDAQMHAWVSAAEGGSAGILVLFHVAGVYELNDSYGREEGDALLQQVAERIQQALEPWPSAFASRRSGCDFSLFIPGMMQEEAAQWLADIKVSVEAIELAAYRGLIKFWLGAAASRSVVSMGKMLSAADAALRLARASGHSDWAVYPVDDRLTDIRPAGEWQQYLKRLIERQEIILHFQPMFTADKNMAGLEVFCRTEEAGEIVTAGVFWPLAERFGLSAALDKLVVQNAVNQLQQNHHLQLSVNISSLSVLDQEFVGWLTRYLSEQSSVANRLVLEFHEKVLSLAGVDFYQLHAAICACQVGIALDHCGITPQTLMQLQSLQLSYIKIDPQFITGIEANQSNRFYMQTLVQLAHASDVNILADGVESESEWQALLDLNVNGGQGFYFGHPSTQTVWQSP